MAPPAEAGRCHFSFDPSGCDYQDARGTTGSGLSVSLNAFTVSDQSRLTPFEVMASGEDRASELATAVANVILSKLGS